MYDELLKNSNIRYLNDLQLSKCIEKLILHCSYNNTVKRKFLNVTTSRFVGWPEYYEEHRLYIYDHYMKILDHIATSKDDTAKINRDTCFDFMRLSLAKNAYNRMTYHINTMEIQTDKEFNDLLINSRVLNYPQYHLTIIKSLILCALYVTVRYSQLSVLNTEPKENSPYSVEFLGRVCQTFDNPKFYSPYLKIILDNLNYCIDQRISKLNSIIDVTESAREKYIRDVIAFLGKYGSGGAGMLVFSPDICEENLNIGNNIIEQVFLTQIRKFIVPFCKYIINKYAFSLDPQPADDPHLYIDINSIEKLTEDFSSTHKNIPITPDSTKIAIGTANVLYAFMHALKNEAFYALTKLPEFNEGVARTIEHEVFLFSRKIYPTKSDLKKQCKQNSTENAENSFVDKMIRPLSISEELKLLIDEQIEIIRKENQEKN